MVPPTGCSKSTSPPLRVFEQLARFARSLRTRILLREASAIETVQALWVLFYLTKKEIEQLLDGVAIVWCIIICVQASLSVLNGGEDEAIACCCKDENEGDGSRHLCPTQLQRGWGTSSRARWNRARGSCHAV